LEDGPHQLGRTAGAGAADGEEEDEDQQEEHAGEDEEQGLQVVLGLVLSEGEGVRARVKRPDVDDIGSDRSFQNRQLHALLAEGQSSGSGGGTLLEKSVHLGLGSMGRQG